MEVSEQLRGDEARLAGVVRRAVGRAVEPGEWEVVRLTGGLGAASGGVFRLSGSGRNERGDDVDWAVVLKVVRRPEEGKAGSARAMQKEALDYWRREPEVYGSGLLEGLPRGVRGPRCYGVEERGDGSVWMWLEDVRDRYGAVGQRWPAARYVAAARHAGRLNGAHAAEKLPEQEWLCTDMVRDWCGRFASATERARDAAKWEHPLLLAAAADARELGERVGELIERKERLFKALTRVPRALGHQDYWRRNLLAAEGEGAADGEEETVVVDWAVAGPGPLGAEVGTLISASLAFAELGPEAVREIEGRALEAYVAGLREVGWEGDVDLVRLGYAAATAIQWGTCPTWLGLLHDEKRHAWAEGFLGVAMPEVVACWIGLTRFTLARGEEALEMAGKWR
jgi:hypothetical protein